MYEPIRNIAFNTAVSVNRNSRKFTQTLDVQFQAAQNHSLIVEGIVRFEPLPKRPHTHTHLLRREKFSVIANFVHLYRVKVDLFRNICLFI